jgi:hypothetical protein
MGEGFGEWRLENPTHHPTGETLPDNGKMHINSSN